MAAPIPQAYIDELLSRLDIVEVISARMPLKKQGREFAACCPFHSENTPSFTVSPSKQFYHCFGCGAHGSAIGFLMSFEHLGFVEAVTELAESINMELPREAGTATNSHRNLLDAMQLATDFYQQTLKGPLGKIARDYLHHRGLRADLILKYGLGYAPDDWQALERHLSNRVSQQDLLHAGLLVRRESSGTYDKFRHRIMFPIRDRRGRAIAFGARGMSDQGPKYLNSPETPLFHKGRQLYGLWEAREEIKRLQQVLIVEGYMDVIGLARQGIHHAVATLGTATTKEHLTLLLRFVPELVFCFDGDRAGRRAAWHALEQALPVMEAGRQIKFVFLPEGEDPDTLVDKEGKQDFLQRIHDAVPLSKFLLQRYAKTVDGHTPDGRAQLVANLAPHLKRIPDGIYRDLLVDELAQISRFSATQLQVRLFGEQSSAAAVTLEKATKSKPGGGNLMRRAVAMLLQHPQLALDLTERQRLAEIERPGISLFLSIVELVNQEPHIQPAGLLERFRDSEHESILAKLRVFDLMIPDEGVKVEFEATVKRIITEHENSRLEQLINKSRQFELTSPERTEWAKLLARSKQDQDSAS